MALNSDLQSVFKTQFDNVAALAAKLAGNASKIANEVQDMTSASIQAQAAFLNKLASAKNASDLIQIQTDHAQASYEATIARSQKIPRPVRRSVPRHGQVHHRRREQTQSPGENALGRQKASSSRIKRIFLAARGIGASQSFDLRRCREPFGMNFRRIGEFSPSEQRLAPWRIIFSNC